MMMVVLLDVARDCGKALPSGSQSGVGLQRLGQHQTLKSIFKKQKTHRVDLGGVPPDTCD